MTGSGNFPPGRALRPEVRMNKEQEEAVMKKAEVTREHMELGERLLRQLASPGWGEYDFRVAAQAIADAEARGEARNAAGGEWVICADNPAVPLLGDVCWVQFDDRTVGSKPHVWVGGLQPWRVNGNIQHAPILAYRLLKAPEPPEQP